MVFVEIQEEQNEDGMEEDTVEIEFMKSVHWHDAGFTLTHALQADKKCSTRFLISRTCKGHILVPVKPPLV